MLGARKKIAILKVGKRWNLQMRMTSSRRAAMVKLLIEVLSVFWLIYLSVLCCLYAYEKMQRGKPQLDKADINSLLNVSCVFFYTQECALSSEWVMNLHESTISLVAVHFSHTLQTLVNWLLYNLALHITTAWEHFNVKLVQWLQTLKARVVFFANLSQSTASPWTHVCCFSSSSVSLNFSSLLKWLLHSILFFF